MNKKIRRQLMLDHLREARARLEGGSEARKRQAERHVRYWNDQLRQNDETTPAQGSAEAPAPAT